MHVRPSDATRRSGPRMLRLALCATLAVAMLAAALPAAPVAHADDSFNVKLSTQHFGVQFLHVQQDGQSATFTLTNGANLWYGIEMTSAPANLGVDPANPSNDLVGAAFGEAGLLQPQDIIPVHADGSLFQNLKLSAGFTGPNQQITLTLNPFSAKAAALDIVRLLLELVGESDTAAQTGLLAPGAIRDILSAFDQSKSLTQAVSDLVAALHAVAAHDLRAAAGSISALASDLLAAFKVDELPILKAIVLRVVGGALPRVAVTAALDSFAANLTLLSNLLLTPINLIKYLLDLALSFGSYLFQQGEFPTVILQSVATAEGTTPAASAPEITYIGSDGNVWEQTVGQGSPHRLTTDAQANSVAYSGLAWSPDGSLLAVDRLTGASYPYAEEMHVLKPDGMVVTRVQLSGRTDNVPFAWSPDGRAIAHRVEVDNNPSSDHGLSDLMLFDAQSGARVKTIRYDRGQTGCGSGWDSFFGAIFGAHDSYGNPDTFSWSPNQVAILVAYVCSNNRAVRVDLATGVETLGYPGAARYQPGGSSVVGVWDDGSISLTDAQGKHVQTLLPAAAQSNHYLIGAGACSWRSDGKLVVCEYQNGIWAVNVDGSEAHILVKGATLDSNGNGRVELLPSLSPDDNLLLYAEAAGTDSNDASQTNAVTTTWYVAQADGTAPKPLPTGSSGAIWRP